MSNAKIISCKTIKTKERLEKITLGCYSDNLASVLVIEKCGGMLINIVEEPSGVTNHYSEIRERSQRI